MKKLLLLATLLVLIIPFVVADHTIYHHVKDIQANPEEYTIIIGEYTESLEIIAAAELAGFLGVTNTLLDSEYTNEKNLIVIGNPDVNTVSKEIIEDIKIKTTIILTDNHLIIAGATPEDTQSVINIIKDLESNKNKLQTDEYTKSTFFAPSSILTTTLVVIGGIIAIILLGLFIVHRKHKLDKKIKQPEPDSMLAGAMLQQTPHQKALQPVQLTPEEKQLVAYIKDNRSDGFTDMQLRKAMKESGWDTVSIEEAFRHI